MGQGVWGVHAWVRPGLKETAVEAPSTWKQGEGTFGGFCLGPGFTQDNGLSKLFPSEHYKLASPHHPSGAVISGQCGALTTLGG